MAERQEPESWAKEDEQQLEWTLGGRGGSTVRPVRQVTTGATGATGAAATGRAGSRSHLRQ